MKYIAAIIVILTAITCAYAGDEALLPDNINQILGRITPDMSEHNVQALFRQYYPNAEGMVGDWSGQTGYVDYKLTPKHTVSISMYNTPTNIDHRYVHSSMIIYIFDWETKSRLNLSIYKWDEGKDKRTEQGVPPYVAQSAPSGER